MSNNNTLVAPSQGSLPARADSYKGSIQNFFRSASPEPMLSEEQLIQQDSASRQTLGSSGPQRSWSSSRDTYSNNSNSPQLSRADKLRSGSFGSDITAVSDGGTIGAPTKVEATSRKNGPSENELLLFVGPIAVFTASLNAALLSFTLDILDDNDSNPTIVVMNGTSFTIADSSNAVGKSATEQVILVCFYLAMLLSLCAGAFAWLMHSDILKFVGVQDTDTSHLPGAQRNGSLFWVVSFILPSTILTCVGLGVLVWSQSTISVGVAMTIGMIYCIWRLSKVLSNIAKGVPKQDIEKGPSDHAANP